MSVENQLSIDPIGQLPAVNALNVGGFLARGALNQYGSSAMAQIADYSQKALGYLGDKTDKAASYLAPQVSATYGALDKWYDLLGISRPKQGFASLQQITDLNNRKKQLDTDVEKAQQNLDLTRQKGTKAQIAGAQAIYDQAVSNRTAEGGQIDQKMQGISETTSGKDSQQAQLDSLRNTPGYQFQLEQGTKAIEGSAANAGYLRSGRTLKALQSYGIGLADQTYQQAVQNASAAVGINMPAVTGTAQGYLNQGATGAGLLNNTGMALGQMQYQIGSDIADVYAGQGSGIAAIYAAQSQQNMAQNNAARSSSGYLAGYNAGGR